MLFLRSAIYSTVLLFALTLVAQAQDDAQDSAMNAREQSAAAELLKATNEDRAAQGLQPLRLDPQLTNAALAHAHRMMEYGNLTHQVPGEPDLVVRVQQAGLHFSTVAENVAQAPTAYQINQDWMQSAPHRANLLDPRVNVVGIAIIRQGLEDYAVEDFARALTAMTPVQQQQQVASLLSSHGLQVESNDALATSYCDASPAGTKPLPKLVMRYSTVDLSHLPPQVEQGITTGAYHRAISGVCGAANKNGFTAYQIVILLY